jgi:nickel/cobalt transporter (NicO) family protein
MLFAALLALLPSAAFAHPLGNFTVNHYTRLEPSGDRVRVIYVLDMAEIPTFQERPRFEADGEAYADRRAEELRQNLRLELNGAAVPLRLEQRSLSFPEGQGGLPTLRLEAVYSAELANADVTTPVELVFRDDNDPARIGWREIIARPGAAGTQIQRSSVPTEDVTHELRQYPDDLLSSPLSAREAGMSFVPGPAAARASTSGTAAGQPSISITTAAQPVIASTGVGVLDRTRSAFVELANGSELTLGFVLFALGVAVVLGAAHALQPGHGKTVVAAYLVGSRGTAKHALFLGATVTATHTAGVYALGFVTLFLSQYIVPERLYPILEIASGVLVVAIGAWLLGSRLLAALGLRAPAAHGHSHDQAPHCAHGHAHAALEDSSSDSGSPRLGHDHDHGHATVENTNSFFTVAKERAQRAVGPNHDHHDDHDQHGDAASHRHAHGGPAHSHAMPEKVSWKSLLALGVSGGLLPCPEALMVLLITIAAHRVVFGLLLIVAFSTGLAAVLVAFGLLLVYARGFFRGINVSSGFIPKALPVISALVIVIAGGVITAQALPQVL